MKCLLPLSFNKANLNKSNPRKEKKEITITQVTATDAGPCKVTFVSNTECKFENLGDLEQTVTLNVSNYIIHLVLVTVHNSCIGGLWISDCGYIALSDKRE